MNHLSDVFKYISHFRHAGHQVGRKVGDMLEVLTYATIARDPELLSRLTVEPKLFGFSDAGHKVEFVLKDEPNVQGAYLHTQINGGEIRDLENVSTFIECKKVGVEQTINSTFKNTFEKDGNNKRYIIPIDIGLMVKFAPRNLERSSFKISFEIDGDTKRVKIVNELSGSTIVHEPLVIDHRIIFALGMDGQCTVIGNNGSLRDFEGHLKACRILEIYEVFETHVTALLNDCLGGPQTPEKAKQASFVALDVRKRRFNSFDKRASENDLRSVLVMTEFSHWEQKSQNMIKACIDQNLVIKDELIVRAFTDFEAAFGGDFYSYITKEQFENNSDVRRITLDLIEEYCGKIYIDIEDGLTKKIVLEENKIKFIL